MTDKKTTPKKEVAYAARWTTSNFDTNLKAINSSVDTMRRRLQGGIKFALEFYKKNQGNAIYLTQLVQACVGRGALDTKRMVAYIESLANVRYTKITNKRGRVQYVFKKAGKGMAMVKPVTGLWYKFEKPDNGGKAKPMDTVETIIRVRARIAKAIEEKNVKDLKAAQWELEALDKMIATMPERLINAA